MHSVTALFESLRPWQFLDEPVATDPLQSLLRDKQLLEEVARGERGAVARLWENPQSLVITRRETRLPTYADACRILDQEGWPVIVRDSGGTAVPHGAGILNFSLIFPLYREESYNLDLVYQALCDPIRIALATLGLEAVYGCVEGAYCDGRYNLVVDGLKITGTAQRQVASKAKERGIDRALLAQAMLMVECDAAAGTEMVNRFYHLAGDSRHYDPTVSTSVIERLCAEGNPAPEQLTERVRNAIRTAFATLAG